MCDKVKKVMIFLVIFLIILIVFLIFLQIENNKKSKVEEKLEYINSDEWNDEVYPRGMPQLFRMYKGKLTAQTMGKSIYYFTTEFVPEYYKQLKDATKDKISSYYNANSEIIAKNTGIENEQDFQNLVVSIQCLSSDTLTLDSFRIDKENIKVSNQCTETILYITYKENTEIGFNVRINNRMERNESSLLYTAITNE